MRGGKRGSDEWIFRECASDGATKVEGRITSSRYRSANRASRGSGLQLQGVGERWGEQGFWMVVQADHLRLPNTSSSEVE